MPGLPFEILLNACLILMSSKTGGDGSLSEGINRFTSKLVMLANPLKILLPGNCAPQTCVTQMPAKSAHSFNNAISGCFKGESNWFGL